jgi:hypothetical protein
MHPPLSTKFKILYDNIPFTGNIVRKAFPEEVVDLHSTYTYYIVEFDTGNDKIYPRVMNIMTNVHPAQYKYIACETEILEY